MENREVISTLFTALVSSVEVGMDDFNDDLDEAKQALKSMSEEMLALREALGKGGTECVTKRGFKDVYNTDGEINRTKLFNDVEILQVNTQALVNTFTQYLRNNAVLLSATNTTLELRLVGNPLLPDIVIKGGNCEEVG